MKKNSIKISFNNPPKEDALPFDEFEEKVINVLEKNDNTSFNVYIKNRMPIIELDRIVDELCKRIEYKMGCKTNTVHINECIASGYIDMYSGATYVIEITS